MNFGNIDIGVRRMTKSVRIENADNSPYYGVVVETWNGEPGSSEAVLTKTDELNYPTMMSTVLLHSGVFFVIREKTLDITRNT